MFVSSFNTYIPTNTSEKVSKVDSEKKTSSKVSFESKLLSTSSATAIAPEYLNTTILPINYVSSKATYNKQAIQDKIIDENKTKDKSTKELTLKIKKQFSFSSATVAYSENSKLFASLGIPKHVINQTPKKIATKQQDLQDLQQQSLRKDMVNTYAQNDKYYQITA